MLDKLLERCRNYSNLSDNDEDMLAKLLEELKEYKNLEDKGLLLRLPCKVGDTAYQIWFIDDLPAIQEMKFCTLSNIIANMELGNFGKTVFFNKEEAEKKVEELKKLGSDNYV